MLTRKLPLAAFLAATLVAASSHACGPFFPNYLLADRQANLLYLPEGSFALESSRLVLADPRLPQWRDTSADKPTSPTAEETLLKTIRASGSLAAAEKWPLISRPPAACTCSAQWRLLNAIAGRVTIFASFWPCPWNNRASGGSRRVIRWPAI